MLTLVYNVVEGSHLSLKQSNPPVAKPINAGFCKKNPILFLLKTAVKPVINDYIATNIVM